MRQNLIDQAIHNGLSQNPESRAYEIASRIEDKRYKNKLIFSNELKELVLSQFSMAENNLPAEEEYKYAIAQNSKGPYVKADRNVIQGDDPAEWAKQIEEYINQNIRNNRDVIVYGIDGDALTITADTSGKASFRNEVTRADGTKRLLTDEEFAAKLRAEGHIDELAKVSKRGKKTVPDRKNHTFAKDGFNYRTAYFEDVDGTQYLVTISVGRNGRINTVYNVGKMQTKKVKPQQLVAQRPSGTETATANFTNNSITENNSVVNSNSMQESENDAKRAAFEATTVSIDIIHREYAGYTKEQIYALKRVGKAFNVDVFIGSDKNFSPNGYYVRAHNGERAKIYLNAGGTNPLNAVIRHEIIHHIKAQSQNAYNAFRTYITDSYKAKYGQEAFDTALEEIAETYKTNTGKELIYDEKVDEFCADVGMDMFRNPEEARKFAFEDKRLAEKVLDIIREVLRKISSVFGNDWDYSFNRLSSLESTATVGEDGEVYHSHRTASESLNTFDVETLKEAERILVEALKTSPQIDGFEVNKYHDETATENSRITLDMNDDTRAEVLNKKSVNVVSIDAEKTKALDEIDIDALQKTLTRHAKPIIEKVAKDFGVLNKAYYNPDIELEFEYSRGSLKESMNKQHTMYGDFVKMLSVFPDVIQNAVGIETHQDKYAGTAREDASLKQMYVLASALSDDTGIIPVKLEVKEFNDKSNKLYLSVVLTKKESRYPHGNLGQNPLNTATPASAISIADLLGIVNPKEGDFLKYFPDSMLDDDQLEGKKVALYKDDAKIEGLKVNLKNETKSESSQEKEIQKSTIESNSVVNIPNDVEESTASESLISIEEYNKNSEYIPSNKKAQNKYNSTVNAMLRKAESLFSVPHGEAVAHIKPIIEEMAAKLVNMKKVCKIFFTDLYY